MLAENFRPQTRNDVVGRDRVIQKIQSLKRRHPRRARSEHLVQAAARRRR